MTARRLCRYLLQSLFCFRKICTYYNEENEWCNGSTNQKWLEQVRILNILFFFLPYLGDRKEV